MLVLLLPSPAGDVPLKCSTHTGLCAVGLWRVLSDSVMKTLLICPPDIWGSFLAPCESERQGMMGEAAAAPSSSEHIAKMEAALAQWRREQSYPC